MLHSWKFAANGVWEEALSIDAQQTMDIAAVERWVAQNSQNIAFEAIFYDDGVPVTMFGIRITQLPKSEQIIRIKNMLLKTSEVKSEADFLKLAANIFPEYTLFASALEALNIGIVSQWYSVGPEIIWNRQIADPYSFDELQRKAPRFFDMTRNPAAIEFWYTAPTDHWYKIYVSDLYAEGYSINPEKYRSAIKRLSEFKL